MTSWRSPAGAGAWRCAAREIYALVTSTDSVRQEARRDIGQQAGYPWAGFGAMVGL